MYSHAIESALNNILFWNCYALNTIDINTILFNWRFSIMMTWIYGIASVFLYNLVISIALVLINIC